MGRKTTGVSKSWGPPKPWNSLMILIKLLHELLSKCYENVCWFCAGHQFEEPPTGARQWSMVKVLSTLHASLCLQTNHQISFHYNHHHNNNSNNNNKNKNKNNNSLEQPTPSNCHSFIPGRTELNRKPSEAAANSHRSSTGSKDWLHRCIGHPNWEHISRVGDSPPTTPVAGQWGHVGTRTLQLSWPCQHMMYM